MKDDCALNVDVSSSGDDSLDGDFALSDDGTLKRGRKMKRAIITGATGAIGMALCGLLGKGGVSVTALIRQNSARKGRLFELAKEGCDIDIVETLPDGVTPLNSNINIDADTMFHMAWGGASGSGRDDAYLQSENIKNTLKAVDLAKQASCVSFIGVGSQAEYGLSNSPLTPNSPTFPENGYGIAKLAAGKLSRIRASQLGIRHIWVRVLSVYGPYDSEGSLITSSIRSMLSGRAAKCSSGEQIWDYLYSLDAARALKLSAERGQDGAVYVLGSGEGRRLSWYIEKMRRAIGDEAKVELGAIPYSKRQVMYLVADTSALEADTGFRAQTSFEDGIRRTVEWCKSSF